LKDQRNAPYYWRMTIENAEISSQSAFDSLRQEDEFGEWWSARDLMPVYGYATWQRFRPVVERGALACAVSRGDVTSNFIQTDKMNSSRHKLADYRLSRHAAYLTAMAGEDGKPEIAAAKNYFAVQTRRAEVSMALLGELSDSTRNIIDLALKQDRMEKEQDRLRHVQEEAGQRLTDFGHDIAAIKRQAENSYRDALTTIRAIQGKAEAAYEEVKSRRDEIMQLSDRVSTVEQFTPLSDMHRRYTGKEAAQLCGLGHIIFFEKLRELKILYIDQQTESHKMYQHYINANWGDAKLQPRRNNPRVQVYVPCFTAKGIAEIRKRLDMPPHSEESLFGDHQY
jgi:hypothetical protein